MTTHSSVLAWRTHGQRSLVGYSPRGHKELDKTEQLTLLFYFQGAIFQAFFFPATHVNSGFCLGLVFQGEHFIIHEGMVTEPSCTSIKINPNISFSQIAPSLNAGTVFP